MTEATTPDRSPEDALDPDKEARLLLNPPAETVSATRQTRPVAFRIPLLPLF